jgi:hypothetical protein
MYTPLDLNAKQEANLNEGLKAAIEAKEGKGAPAQMGYDAPVNQAIIDPMTGMPISKFQPSNEMGGARQLFSDQTKQVADNMFGQQVPGTFGSALAKKNCNKKY